MVVQLLHTVWSYDIGPGVQLKIPWCLMLLPSSILAPKRGTLPKLNCHLLQLALLEE